MNIVRKKEILEILKNSIPYYNESLPINVIDMCKSFNIDVYEEHFKSNSSGYMISNIDDDKIKQQYNNSSHIIVVNASDIPCKKRLTIAHELAHFCLHRTVGQMYVHREVGTASIKEAEATFFASELLMPQVLVEKAVFELINDSKDPKIDDIIFKVADMFDVCEEAANVRLNTLCLI